MRGEREKKEYHIPVVNGTHVPKHKQLHLPSQNDKTNCEQKQNNFYTYKVMMIFNRNQEKYGQTDRPTPRPGHRPREHKQP